MEVDNNNKSRRWSYAKIQSNCTFKALNLSNKHVPALTGTKAEDPKT